MRKENMDVMDGPQVIHSTLKDTIYQHDDFTEPVKNAWVTELHFLTGNLV